MRQRGAAHYQRNWDAIRAKALANYPERAEKERAASAAWRMANPERYRAMLKAWRAAHREEIRLKRRETYLANQKEVVARNRQWRKANPEKHSAQAQRRRAHKLGSPSDLTLNQWEAIKDFHGGRCVYCGKKPARLTQDHITPLSMGGAHTAQNVLPACPSCNSKKGIGNPLKSVQPMLIA